MLGLDGGSPLRVPGPAAYLLPHCPQTPIRGFLGLVVVAVMTMVFRTTAACSTIVIFTVVLGETYLRYGLGGFWAVCWGGFVGAGTSHGKGTGNDLGSSPP